MVESITMIAPEPSIEPVVDESTFEGKVELIGEEPWCRPATWHERFEIVVVSDALTELFTVEKVRNVVPLMISHTPGHEHGLTPPPCGCPETTRFQSRCIRLHRSWQ